MSGGSQGGPPLRVGSAVIKPEAEPEAGHAPPPGVSAQDEENSYVVDAQKWKLEQERINLGLAGKIFGGTAAASNIAGLIIILSLVAILISYCMKDPSQASSLQDKLIALIGSALGYMFGSAGKK